MTIGIIPAAGTGSRVQPLAFSKELLPVGARIEDHVARPRAVAEYAVERLILGGAQRLCFIVAPDKTDIMSYFGGRVSGVPVCYVVQPRPAGLCDAIFCALPFMTEDESAIVALPDTVWFPAHILRDLPDGVLSFALFPVSHPELFDAVLLDPRGEVRSVDVKSARPSTSWVWGAFRAPGATLRELERLWNARDRVDLLLGTLVNAYLAHSGRAVGVRSGRTYVDVGTHDGYREAVRLLHAEAELEASVPERSPIEGTA
ncbi:MAG TPA: sugar phosphate nucleotidyltransferase [Polyangia bacterium]|nr:sugar phosphate nucleotidyltransferase [Polyangia bacterium]